MSKIIFGFTVESSARYDFPCPHVGEVGGTATEKYCEVTDKQQGFTSEMVRNIYDKFAEALYLVCVSNDFNLCVQLLKYVTFIAKQAYDKDIFNSYQFNNYFINFMKENFGDQVTICADPKDVEEVSVLLLNKDIVNGYFDHGTLLVLDTTAADIERRLFAEKMIC